MPGMYHGGRSGTRETGPRRAVTSEQRLIPNGVQTGLVVPPHRDAGLILFSFACRTGVRDLVDLDLGVPDLDRRELCVRRQDRPLSKRLAGRKPALCQFL